MEHTSHRSLVDFRDVKGPNIFDRLSTYYAWQRQRREEGTWPFDKTLHSAPRPNNSSLDGCGRRFAGPNLCSQDYLSLSTHPQVIDAVQSAARNFGVHSAGSTALLGNTVASRLLQKKLAEFVGHSHVLLFPTGWAAGYGTVKGLVQPDDYVIIDALAHACLREGACAATRHVFSVPHLDNAAVAAKLKRIRERVLHNAILVIVESLYSMDSDVPNLSELQELCQSYDATLLVDVAHDLGAVAPGGGGIIELQGMVGRIDLIIGSFSKTFASNGGFVASHRPEVIEYLKIYSCPQTFSNALSPLQVSAITKCLDIITSAEGSERRLKLKRNSEFIRSKLSEESFRVLGEPSPIVPVFLGEDRRARSLWKHLSEIGCASNFVEFPGVAVNAARLRLQIQAEHSWNDLLAFVNFIKTTRDYFVQLGTQ